MSRKSIAPIAVLALVVGSASMSADASVIKTSPNQALSQSPYVVQLGTDAGYSFEAGGVGSSGSSLRVATNGTALVAGSNLFGYEYIDKYASGDSINDQFDTFISSSPAGTYSDIPTTANAASPFIGLSFLIDGLRHFGYARFNENTGGGFSLANYAYETVAGKGISAGASTSLNEVPAPGGLLGLLALTVLMVSSVTKKKMTP